MPCGKLVMQQGKWLTCIGGVIAGIAWLLCGMVWYGICGQAQALSLYGMVWHFLTGKA